MSITMKIWILAVLWLIVFVPVYPELVGSWISNSNNSHGVLAPLVAAYMVWQKRSSLAGAKLSHSWAGGGLLASCIILFLVSYAGGIAVTMRLSMIGSLLGLVLFVFGREVFRLLIFPLGFLFFMIPVPDSIVGTVSLPLQLLATTTSAILLKQMSIPVFQEGNMLYFIQTQLEVAEACSGVRSLVALIMLSTLFAHMSRHSRGRKLILIVAAVPLALLANIIRVSFTGVLAHFYGSRVAQGFLHSFSGLVVFMFGFVALAALSALLAWAPKSRRMGESS